MTARLATTATCIIMHLYTIITNFCFFFLYICHEITLRATNYRYCVQNPTNLSYYHLNYVFK